MKKFYQISGLIVIIGIILFIFGHAKGGNEDINNIHSGQTTNIGNFLIIIKEVENPTT